MDRARVTLDRRTPPLGRAFASTSDATSLAAAHQQITSSCSYDEQYRVAVVTPTAPTRKKERHHPSLAFGGWIHDAEL